VKQPRVDIIGTCPSTARREASVSIIPVLCVAIMETQSYAGLSHTLQTVAIATLIFAVCAFIPKLDYRLKLAKLPLFGASSSGEKQRQIFIKSAREIYNDGYKKVCRFRASTSDDIDESIVQKLCLPRCLV
jgi:hypothetical protein